MTTLVLATRNPDKLAEMRTLFAGLPFARVSSAAELDAPEVVEDGTTLEENALKKARELAAFAGGWALADDTGLEVEALGGAPGVISARYAGPQASYADNCAKLLEALADVAPAQRGAHFRTVMALVRPGEDERWVEGVLSGRITRAGRGSGGFGYDPIFELADPAIPAALRGRTLAELAPAEKNRVSHRARAAAAMRLMLEKLLVGA